MEVKGKKFKKIRKEQGLTQIQVAEGICQQSTVSLLENENKLPSLDVLELLMSRLGISVETILVNDKYDDNYVSQLISLMLKCDASAIEKKLSQVKINGESTRDNIVQHFFGGFVHLYRKEYEDAIFCFGLTIAQMASVEGYRDYLSATYYGMSIAYKMKRDYAKAKEMINLALEKVQELSSIDDKEEESLLFAVALSSELYQINIESSLDS